MTAERRDSLTRVGVMVAICSNALTILALLTGGSWYASKMDSRVSSVEAICNSNAVSIQGLRDERSELREMLASMKADIQWLVKAQGRQ